MNHYKETNNFHIQGPDFDIQDPGDDMMPSQRFGIEVFVGLFFLFVLFSGILAISIIACSRKQEKATTRGKEASAEKTHEDLKSNLSLKPWCPGTDATPRNMTDASMTVNSNYTTDSELDVSRTSSEIEIDVELQMPTDNQCSIDCAHKDGSACALCHEEYQSGQPVYESNNPQCGHQFHKVCMDKWLHFQNSCPTCNQPFVLRTV